MNDIKKPNIIIVNPDQWRGDMLGYLGYSAAKTPNLDQIIKKDGVAFTNAFAQGELDDIDLDDEPEQAPPPTPTPASTPEAELGTQNIGEPDDDDSDLIPTSDPLDDVV